MAISPENFYMDWMGTDSVIVTDNIQNTLTLGITNISGSTIAVDTNDRIKLYFPVGNESYHFIVKNSAQEIRCTPPYDWILEFDKLKCEWVIYPKEEINIESGESIVVVFSNIVTEKNDLIGRMSCLDIAFKQNEADALMRIPIFLHEAPARISKFTCNHSVAGILDDVTFSWKTMGGKTGVYLLPDYGPDTKRNLKAVDEVSCTVMETTEYSLQVSNNGNTVIENYPVHVFEPVIKDFSYERSKTKKNELILSVTVENTRHCYINCGVGRVECKPDYSEGYCIAKCSVNVAIDSYIKEYTLSCLGLNGLVRRKLTVPNI